MFRLPLALVALTAAAATAGAQPGNLPLAPGVHPGSPIGPGTQFLPQSGYRFTPPGQGMTFGARRLGGFGGFGGPTFFPTPFYYGYGYGLGYGDIEGTYYLPRLGPTIVIAPPPAPPRPPEPSVVLANEFPATLVVQFPAAADVWLNGRAVKGEAAEERTLTSPVLRPGESFAFDVKARWASGGKTYETTRTVTLGPGDRSRLIVVSGTQVK